MNPLEDFSASTRRQWVKQFLLASATALSGPRWTGTVLADVTATGPGPAIVRLKAASIPAIAAPGGSVQLSFIEYLKPFTLNLVTETRFVTLDSICTHNGCTVGRYKEQVVSADPRVTATYMLCPCHGSRYDLEGRVFRDGTGVSTEPAQDDLAQMDTSYHSASDVVSVTIPGLSLHINSIGVHQTGPGESVRMKLVFPVTGYAAYEIYHKSSL